MKGRNRGSRSMSVLRTTSSAHDLRSKLGIHRFDSGMNGITSNTRESKLQYVSIVPSQTKHREISPSSKRDSKLGKFKIPNDRITLHKQALGSILRAWFVEKQSSPLAESGREGIDDPKLLNELPYRSIILPRHLGKLPIVYRAYSVLSNERLGKFDEKKVQGLLYRSEDNVSLDPQSFRDECFEMPEVRSFIDEFWRIVCNGGSSSTQYRPGDFLPEIVSYSVYKYFHNVLTSAFPFMHGKDTASLQSDWLHDLTASEPNAWSEADKSTTAKISENHSGEWHRSHFERQLLILVTEVFCKGERSIMLVLKCLRELFEKLFPNLRVEMKKLKKRKEKLPGKIDGDYGELYPQRTFGKENFIVASGPVNSLNSESKLDKRDARASRRQSMFGAFLFDFVLRKSNMDAAPTKQPTPKRPHLDSLTSIIEETPTTSPETSPPISPKPKAEPNLSAKGKDEYLAESKMAVRARTSSDGHLTEVEQKAILAPKIKVNSRLSRRNSMISTKDIKKLRSDPDMDLISELKQTYDPTGKGASEGQSNLYSDKALLQRESLKFDKQVLHELNRIWNLVDSDKNRVIDYAEFSVMHHKLFVLYHAHIPESERPTPEDEMSMLREDWAKDSAPLHDKKLQEEGRKYAVALSRDPNEGLMTRQHFIRAWFHMADLWTDEISADIYANFLRYTISKIAKIGLDGKLRWRSDNEIVKLIEVDKEQSSKSESDFEKGSSEANTNQVTPEQPKAKHSNPSSSSEQVIMESEMNMSRANLGASGEDKSAEKSKELGRIASNLSEKLKALNRDSEPEKQYPSLSAKETKAEHIVHNSDRSNTSERIEETFLKEKEDDELHGWNSFRPEYEGIEGIDPNFHGIVLSSPQVRTGGNFVYEGSDRARKRGTGNKANALWDDNKDITTFSTRTLDANFEWLGQRMQIKNGVKKNVLENMRYHKITKFTLSDSSTPICKESYRRKPLEFLHMLGIGIPREGEIFGYFPSTNNVDDLPKRLNSEREAARIQCMRNLDMYSPDSSFGSAIFYTNDYLMSAGDTNAKDMNHHVAETISRLMLDKNERRLDYAVSRVVDVSIFFSGKATNENPVPVARIDLDNFLSAARDMGVLFYDAIFIRISVAIPDGPQNRLLPFSELHVGSQVTAVIHEISKVVNRHLIETNLARSWGIVAETQNAPMFLRKAWAFAVSAGVTGPTAGIQQDWASLVYIDPDSDENGFARHLHGKWMPLLEANQAGVFAFTGSAQNLYSLHQNPLPSVQNALKELTIDDIGICENITLRPPLITLAVRNDPKVSKLSPDVFCGASNQRCGHKHLEAGRKWRKRLAPGNVSLFKNKQMYASLLKRAERSWHNSTGGAEWTPEDRKKRFVLDGLLNKSECAILRRSGRKYMLSGASYSGRAKKDSASNNNHGAAFTLIDADFSTSESRTARLLLRDALSRIRAALTSYFNLTKLVCSNSQLSARYPPGSGHPLHSDDCIFRSETGLCEPSNKVHECCVNYHFSAILFLNDQPETYRKTGEQFWKSSRFYWHERLGESTPQEIIEAEWTYPRRTRVDNKCGRLVGFSAGEENPHGVESIKFGSDGESNLVFDVTSAGNIMQEESVEAWQKYARFALTNWFSTDTRYSMIREDDEDLWSDDLELKNDNSRFTDWLSSPTQDTIRGL